VDYQKENWRDATAFILSEAQPGDAVLFYAYFVRHSFEYYLGRSGAPDDFLRLMELASEQYALGGGGLQPDPDLELLKRLPDQHTRVWLVLSHDQIPHLGRDVQSRFIPRSSLSRREGSRHANDNHSFPDQAVQVSTLGSFILGGGCDKSPTLGFLA
jgi:hypothetical protein